MQVDLHGLFDDNTSFDYEDYIENSSRSQASSVLIPLLYSVGLLWGLLGNGLVLAILWQKRMNLSVMDIFILHLGVADSLLMLTLPIWAVDAVKGWILGTGMCKVAGALFKINFYCGIIIMACVSCYCYQSTVHAGQYSRKNPKVIHSICLIIWIFCLALSIPDWIFLAVSDETYQDKVKCDYYYSFDSWRLASRLIHLIVGFALPTSGLLFCWFCIFRQLQLGSKILQKKDRRMHVIGAMVLIFFICWTPYNITLIVDTAQPVNSVDMTGVNESEGKKWKASNITAILGLMHCVINPVIYFFLSKEFRRRALTMIKFSGCETEHADFSLWDSCELNDHSNVQKAEQVSLNPMTNIEQMTQTQDQDA